MQRSADLVVLSREHHVALELARRLRRAGAADAEPLTQAALEFWRTEGREHFRLEEELLLPAFARRAGADDADIVRVLVEHGDIRRRIGDLEEGNVAGDARALNGLGEALHDHVRYEERTFFARVEALLDCDELASLGNALRCVGDSHDPPRA